MEERRATSDGVTPSPPLDLPATIVAASLAYPDDAPAPDSWRSLRGLFETAPVPIALVSISDGRYLDVNPSHADLFGRTVDDCPGRQFQAPEDWVDDGLDETLIGALRDRDEVRNLAARLRGRERIVDVLITARAAHLPEGRIAVVYLADVTQIKKMELKLRQIQKMETVGNLAGGIAHDFNNLLGGISGFAELIQIQPDTPAVALRHAQQITKAVRRAAELTRQLLIYSRSDSAQLRPVVLDEIVEEAIAMLVRSIDPRILIERDLATGTSTIQGDAARLETVVLNLCINARDAMPEGGRLTIATRLVTREDVWQDGTGQLLPPGQYVELMVEDTGTGIDPDIRDLVMEPFFTTKEPGRGTGLGLSTVHDAVQAHAGGLHLDSRVGVGTRFRLHFRVDALARSELDRPRRSAPTGTGRIFVVDDDDTIRRLLSSYLIDLGYDIVSARDGTAALDTFTATASSIDAVVLDISMPKMSGIDVLRGIRAISPTVPVLLVSGRATPQDIDEAMRMGASGVLEKPFELSALGDHLARVTTEPDVSSAGDARSVP